MLNTARLGSCQVEFQILRPQPGLGPKAQEFRFSLSLLRAPCWGERTPGYCIHTVTAYILMDVRSVASGPTPHRAFSGFSGMRRAIASAWQSWMLAHSVVCCMVEWVPCYLAGMKPPASPASFSVCALREQGRLAVAVVVVVEAVVEHGG